MGIRKEYIKQILTGKTQNVLDADRICIKKDFGYSEVIIAQNVTDNF